MKRTHNVSNHVVAGRDSLAESATPRLACIAVVIEGFIVEAYQQRVIDEKRDLDDRAKKLSGFIGLSPLFLKLSAAEQELMKEQCETMWQYSEILEKRIALFESR